MNAFFSYVTLIEMFSLFHKIQIKNAPPKKFFLWCLAITTILRVIIAYLLPITGDEVYYAVWGLRSLEWGYYDHPPGVAWIFAFSFLFGIHFWTTRLFGILLPPVLSILMVLFLKKMTTKDSSYLWASVFLWVPLFLFGVIVTPDTVLVPMVFLSAIFLWTAQKTNVLTYAVISGLFLGGAFLSKLLIVPYVLFLWIGMFFVSSGQRKNYFKNLCVLSFTALPFVGIWAWWNSFHCWPHFMLNAMNRHVNGEWGFKNLIYFLLFQILIFTPILIIYFFKNYKSHWQHIKRNKQFYWFGMLGLGPIIMFAISALRFPSSLHWALPYQIIIFVFLGFIFSINDIYKILKYMIFLTSFLFFLFLGVYSQVENIMPLHPQGKTMNLFFHRNTFSDYLKKYYDQGYMMASDSYTLSSLLEYQSYVEKWPTPFAVLGGTTFFGRQDDIAIDYKKLDGRNFAIFSRGEVQREKYQEWFQEIKIEKIQIKQWSYYIIEGNGFKYERYKDIVLKNIVQLHYQFPKFLPIQGCPIMDRNF